MTSNANDIGSNPLYHKQGRSFTSTEKALPMSPCPDLLISSRFLSVLSMRRKNVRPRETDKEVGKQKRRKRRKERGEVKMGSESKWEGLCEGGTKH